MPILGLQFREQRPGKGKTVVLIAADDRVPIRGDIAGNSPNFGKATRLQVHRSVRHSIPKTAQFART